MRFTSIGEHRCHTECGVGGLIVRGRLTHRRPADDGWVKDMMVSLVQEIALNCLQLGARTIGHVKALLQSKAGAIQADTIGIPQGVQVSGSLQYPSTCFEIRIHSVVPGLCEHAVKAATLEGLYETVEKTGFLFQQDAAQVYFEEFDALDLDMPYRQGNQRRIVP